MSNYDRRFRRAWGRRNGKPWRRARPNVITEVQREVAQIMERAGAPSWWRKCAVWITGTWKTFVRRLAWNPSSLRSW